MSQPGLRIAVGLGESGESETAPTPWPEQSVESDLGQVAAIEAHCVRAWPPRFVEHTGDGWVLRATPGLPGRGRSNHALPPARAIDPSEYDGALKRAGAFAALHGVECGLQIGPTDLHATFLNELEGRGWSLGEDVLVMAAETGVVATGAARAGRVAADAGPVIAGAANAGPVIAGAANAGPVAGGAGPGGAGAAAVGIGHGGLELDVADHATPEWVAAWAHCDRRPDIQDHLVHLFPRMAGIASFVWCGTSAVGISVELDGIVGLFCLAVDPDLRRRGLGKALVLSMLARHSAPLTYLQVFSRNIAGVALYRSLGFEEIYRYRHAVAPDVRARPPQSGPRPRGL